MVSLLSILTTTAQGGTRSEASVTGPTQLSEADIGTSVTQCDMHFAAYIARCSIHRAPKQCLRSQFMQEDLGRPRAAVLHLWFARVRGMREGAEPEGPPTCRSCKVLCILRPPCTGAGPGSRTTFYKPLGAILQNASLYRKTMQIVFSGRETSRYFTRLGGLGHKFCAPWEGWGSIWLHIE